MNPVLLSIRFDFEYLIDNFWKSLYESLNPTGSPLFYLLNRRFSMGTQHEKLCSTIQYRRLLGIAASNNYFRQKKKTNYKHWKSVFFLEKMINLAVLFYLSKIDKDCNFVASKSYCIYWKILHKQYTMGFTLLMKIKVNIILNMITTIMKWQRNKSICSSTFLNFLFSWGKVNCMKWQSARVLKSTVD